MDKFVFHDEKFEQFQHNQGGNYESAYSQKSNAKTNIRDGQIANEKSRQNRSTRFKFNRKVSNDKQNNEHLFGNLTIEKEDAIGRHKAKSFSVTERNLTMVNNLESSMSTFDRIIDNKLPASKELVTENDKKTFLTGNNNIYEMDDESTMAINNYIPKYSLYVQNFNNQEGQKQTYINHKYNNSSITGEKSSCVPINPLQFPVNKINFSLCTRKRSMSHDFNKPKSSFYSTIRDSEMSMPNNHELEQQQQRDQISLDIHDCKPTFYSRSMYPKSSEFSRLKGEQYKRDNEIVKQFKSTKALERMQKESQQGITTYANNKIAQELRDDAYNIAADTLRTLNTPGKDKWYSAEFKKIAKATKEINKNSNFITYGNQVDMDLTEKKISKFKKGGFSNMFVTYSQNRNEQLVIKKDNRQSMKLHYDYPENVVDGIKNLTCIKLEDHKVPGDYEIEPSHRQTKKEDHFSNGDLKTEQEQEPGFISNRNQYDVGKDHDKQILDNDENFGQIKYNYHHKYDQSEYKKLSNDEQEKHNGKNNLIGPWNHSSDMHIKKNRTDTLDYKKKSTDLETPAKEGVLRQGLLDSLVIDEYHPPIDFNTRSSIMQLQESQIENLSKSGTFSTSNRAIHNSQFYEVANRDEINHEIISKAYGKGATHENSQNFDKKPEHYWIEMTKNMEHRKNVIRFSNKNIATNSKASKIQKDLEDNLPSFYSTRQICKPSRDIKKIETQTDPRNFDKGMKKDGQARSENNLDIHEFPFSSNNAIAQNEDLRKGKSSNRLIKVSEGVVGGRANFKNPKLTLKNDKRGELLIADEDYIRKHGKNNTSKNRIGNILKM